MTTSPDDASIAAYHRAAQTRRIWIAGVAGIACLVLGTTFAVLALSMDAPLRVAGRKYGTAIVGIGMVVVGLRLTWQAIATTVARLRGRGPTADLVSEDD